jgi:excisionase family DNA binding protein
VKPLILNHASPDAAYAVVWKIAYAVVCFAARKQQPPQKSPEGLRSAREAAAYLGISFAHWKDTVRAELPAVAIGRRRLYDRKDLDAWVSTHKVGSSACPKDELSTLSASGTTVSASTGARAAQILARLRSKQRASTRTS